MDLNFERLYMYVVSEVELLRRKASMEVRGCF